MAKAQIKYLLIFSVIFLFLYIFLAAQPIPQETILVTRWLTSLESGFPIVMSGSPPDERIIVPFHIGNRFGFAQDNGHFILNRVKREMNLSFSSSKWSEYEAMPSSINILDPQSTLLMTINAPRGYPFFLDEHIFILGNEQNSISRLDTMGNISWTYDFSAPLTCIDAASGFILAGTLDGALELLSDTGGQIFSFEPGGSRLAVVLGCAVSKDGTRLAVISGIDDQRFLLLEKTEDSFRVVYHEFLGDGFRRAVHLNFIDNDNKVVYEREGGLSIYDIPSRTSVTLPLEGSILAIASGDDKYLVAITAQSGNHKRFIGIKLPDLVVFNAPFRSDNIYLGREKSRIFLGGDRGLISFELGKK